MRIDADRPDGIAHAALAAAHGCDYRARTVDARRFVRSDIRRSTCFAVRSLRRARAALCAAFAARARAPRTRAQTTLRVVMHSDLKIVDPIWTTAYITRNHGYMIYDTLFATDANGQVKPQMIDKYDRSAPTSSPTR